jgi:hypothetical protein
MNDPRGGALASVRWKEIAVKSMTLFSRRFRHIGTLVAVLATVLTGLTVRPAAAHETQCPYCRLDVVQDTAEQDNEVALRYGRKRIEYRCVYCALAQAKSEFKEDLTILAPSEIKGKPVLIARRDGKWSVLPQTAVFSAAALNHQQCQVAYRAFTTPAAHAAYAKQHGSVLGNTKPLSLDEMVERAK